MRVNSIRLRLQKFAMCVLLAIAASPLAQASTVAQMDFDEIVNGAELIFRGRVLAAEARQQPGELIKTWVRFAILDVVKGDYLGDEIELSFLGGRLDGRQLEVTDMIIPQVGETGFYFVETLLNQQVNPLFGWDQGHFLIVEEPSGESVVTTVHHEPLLSLEPESTGSIITRPMNILPDGLAQPGPGRLSTVESPFSQPVNTDEFKASILTILALPK